MKHRTDKHPVDISVDMDETLIIYAGEEEKQLTIHEHTVAKIPRAIRLSIARKRSRGIRLRIASNHKASTLETYLYWLHDCKIIVTEHTDRHWNELLELHKLGNSVKDTKFCNAVLDNMVSRVPNDIPSYESTLWVWNETPSNSIYGGSSYGCGVQLRPPRRSRPSRITRTTSKSLLRNTLVICRNCIIWIGPSSAGAT